MRTPTIAALAATLLFTACGTIQKTDISSELQNPLTASRYGDELADRLADLIIQKDPVIEKDGVEDMIKKKIETAKNLANEARDVQGRGMMGALISVKQTTIGYGLYVDDVLWLSSDFTTDPGPSVHVFLTTVVDPRDAAFPDDTAIDLGELQTPYGAQGYDVPHQDKPELYRTLVIFDTKLERIYGFAQLSGHPGN